MTETLSQPSESKLEGWAIVEVMGHGRFAGQISEHKVGVAVLIRVDVPAVGNLPAFTKLIAPAALFGITPCDEATAKTAAEEFRSTPVYLYSAAPRLAGPTASSNSDNYSFDEDEAVNY